MHRLLRGLLVVLAVPLGPGSLVFAGLPRLPEEKAKVGDVVPDHRFARIHQHDGRDRLAQLRGQPVLIAGFRQHITEGLHAAWFADEMAREYGRDGLIVILEDRRPWNTEERRTALASFWLRFFESKPWFVDGSEESKLPDLPVERAGSARDEHSIVLIGVDGRLLLEGSIPDAGEKVRAGDLRDLCQRAIRAEIERASKGYGDTKEEAKVRAAVYGKSEYAKAGRLLDAVPDPASREVLREELLEHLRNRLLVVRHGFEHGFVTDAAEAFTGLRKACKGVPELEAMLADTARLADDPGLAAERSLEARLDRIWRPVAQRDFGAVDLDLYMELRFLADQNAETAVGERAAELAPLAKDLVRILRKMSLPDLDAKIAERLAKGR